MQLTQKETSLLKDLKSEEQLCIEKYKKHSECAKDAQLKNLFTQLAQMEQQHYDTISQIENGTVPQQQSGGSQQQSGGSQQQTFTATYTSETPEKQNDCYLCSDVLSTEKHVSSTYNTSIFEFKDENLRNVLNHIQKEEQNHGKMIYDYMSANGMYS
jgi:rubrerythrin